MAGSTYGTLFKISTWGESHGKGIGVVIDGCPAGLSLSESDIQPFLDRRKPGQTPYSTPRKEEDKVTILSGVFEGITTGCPISLWVENTSQRSHDYSQIASCYRPGHADYTAHVYPAAQPYETLGQEALRAEAGNGQISSGYGQYQGNERGKGRLLYRQQGQEAASCNREGDRRRRKTRYTSVGY